MVPAYKVSAMRDFVTWTHFRSPLLLLADTDTSLSDELCNGR